jgi:hypothetical protein
VRAAVILLGTLVFALPAGATDPRGPQQRHTAGDTQLAKSVGLTLHDLPGDWRAAKGSLNFDTPSCTSRPDESGLVQTALIDPSFFWRDGASNMGSEVDVFRSARAARLDWRLSTLRVLTGCVRSELQHGGTRVTVSSARELRIANLSERTVHHRLTFVLYRPKKKPITAVIDVIAVGKGRVTTTLHSFTADRPIQGAGMTAFARVVANRLNADPDI